jgi:hypothetical protein
MPQAAAGLEGFEAGIKAGAFTDFDVTEITANAASPTIEEDKKTDSTIEVMEKDTTTEKEDSFMEAMQATAGSEDAWVWHGPK